MLHHGSKVLLLLLLPFVLRKRVPGSPLRGKSELRNIRIKFNRTLDTPLMNWGEFFFPQT